MKAELTELKQSMSDLIEFNKSWDGSGNRPRIYFYPEEAQTVLELIEKAEEHDKVINAVKRAIDSIHEYNSFINE